MIGLEAVIQAVWNAGKVCKRQSDGKPASPGSSLAAKEARMDASNRRPYVRDGQKLLAISLNEKQFCLCVLRRRSDRSTQTPSLRQALFRRLRLSIRYIGPKTIPGGMYSKGGRFCGQIHFFVFACAQSGMSKKPAD